MCKLFLYPFADGVYTLGHIDARLPTLVANNGGTGRGLHTDNRGLFFLPTPIGTKGRVTEVCVFGYPRIEDEGKFEDEMGKIDLATKFRVFLFIVLYRPSDKIGTLVYSPAVVYHGLIPGCLSQNDGLNWMVEQGDLLGAFIPDYCTTAEDLISQDDVDTFNEVELMEFEFCPAQIDLIASSQCYYALYLNSTEGSPLDDIKSVDFVNVSARLNIQVMIKEGEGLRTWV